MATSSQKRQLQRREALKAKRQEFASHSQALRGERMAASVVGSPIFECGHTLTLWETGLGWVYLARQLPNGDLAYALFLVDIYCLGVKDAMAGVKSVQDFEVNVLGRMPEEEQDAMKPAEARKLVESAVAYAHSLGFAPHPDYEHACGIFADIDPSQCKEEFVFGRDGKPCFVAGPNDTRGRCRDIMGNLLARCGVDGFHFVLPFTDRDFLPEPLQSAGIRQIEGPVEPTED